MSIQFECAFVSAPATIARHPIPVTVLEEENATLTCTATGSPELSIMWKRVGEPSTEVSPSTGVHVYVTETAAEGGQEVWGPSLQFRNTIS